MTKLENYKNIFCEVFEVEEDRLNEKFTFQEVTQWTSLVHLTLIEMLEDAFDIIFDPEDIMHYGSFENGKLILERYGVDFNSEVK